MSGWSQRGLWVSSGPMRALALIFFASLSVVACSDSGSDGSGSPDAGDDATDVGDVDPDVDPDTDPDVDPDVDPDTDPDVDPDTDPDVEPDTDPDVDPDVEPDTDPDVDPDVDPDTDPDVGVCDDGAILCDGVTVSECVSGTLVPLETCPLNCAESGGVAACVCGTDGDCNSGDVCDSSGVCVEQNCVEGELRCLEGNVSECIDNELVTIETCGAGCSADSGSPECLCNDSGDCELSEYCDENSLCVDDVCDGSTNRCDDSSTAVRCRPDGSEEQVIDCGDLSCSGFGRCICETSAQCGPDASCDIFTGECVANVCSPGENFCLGGAVQQCNSVGDGSFIVADCDGGCDESGGVAACACASNADCGVAEYCDGDTGTCAVDVCTGGTRTCQDGDAAACRSDGSGFDVTDCGALSCQGGFCVCTTNDDCGAGEYCSSGSCEPQVCTPDEVFCDGNLVRSCNSAGSASTPVELCVGGCTAGECTCADADDCGPGFDCVSGVCECPSNELCGEDDVCCPTGTACETRESCAGGDCVSTELCLPPCETGLRCGDFGELCCEGATSLCGPTGECIRDCGANAVCGQDFESCCGSGELCIFDECRTPTLNCDSFVDCDYDEYCETSIGQCLPNDFPNECNQEGDFDAFAPTELWHWDGVNVGGTNYRNVLTVPVTADMNGDGVPDVVVQAYAGSLGNTAIVVLSGDDGRVLYTNTERGIHGAGHVAIADIDGDGYPEIATSMQDGMGMIEDIVTCSEPDDDDDCYLWQEGSGTINGNVDGGAPLFADFNGDGDLEVVLGSVVIDALSGDVIADGGSGSAAEGSLGGQFIAAVADVDEDGELELLTGDCAWKVDFANEELDELWCASGNWSNGFPGVADMDGDGDPEVVVIDNGRVRILNGNDGSNVATIDIPGGGHGGPPNIADFDGDGRAEIGTAGIGCYSVFDLDCLGSETGDSPGCQRPVFPSCTEGVDCIVDACSDNDLTNGSGDGVLWSIATQDKSSETTGSSVFDFQGDGVAEVLYNDECRLYALDGRNGQPFLVRMNTSRTNSEYPIVVDVNGDRRSEFLFVANNDEFSRDCEDIIVDRPDYFPECDGSASQPDACTQGTRGVFALSDPNDQWVRTRAVWNQHAYQITNVNEDGTVPAAEDRSWEIFNLFRANRQGEVPLNSPDPAVVSFSASRVNCPPTITLTAQIANEGTRGIPAGMPVAFSRLDGGGTPEFLGSTNTDQALLPGEIVSVSLEITISSDDARALFDYAVEVNTDDTFVPDCEGGNNTALIEDIACITGGPIVSQ